MSGKDEPGWMKEWKARPAAVRSAKSYFDDLPTPLRYIDTNKGGRIDVWYDLPKPYSHRARYWPAKKQWRFVRQHFKGEDVDPNITESVTDPLRYAEDPEDFVRQFAPGALATGTVLFDYTGLNHPPDAPAGLLITYIESMPERLRDYYTSLGPEHLERAIARGEDIAPPAQGTTPREATGDASDENPEDAGEGRPVGREPGRAGPTQEEPTCNPEVGGVGEQHNPLIQHQEGTFAPVTAQQENRKRSAGESDPQLASTSPQGFILKNGRVFKTQTEAADRLLGAITPPVTPATRRFFWHVYLTGARDKRGKPTFVPISAELIERELGEHSTWKVWAPLYDAGLIDRKLEHKDWKLSRRFSLRPHARDEIDAAAPRPGDPGAAQFVDPFTGRAPTARADKRYKRDKEGRAYPTVILEALAELRREGCPADLEAAQAHVDALHTDWCRTFAVAAEAGHPTSGPEHDAWKKAAGRWQSDSYCLRTMLLTAPTHDGGVWRCIPWYARNPQSSGRLTEVGGLQNCSRQMRHAALAHLRASHDLRNYDLVSSQAWGLLQHFEDDDIDADWLRAYLTGDRADYAERAFGDRSERSVKAFKQTVLSLAMGATLPTTTGWIPKREDGEPRKVPDIAKLMRNTFGGGHATAEAEAKLRSLRAVVRPFVQAREQWRKQLGLQDDHGGRLARPGRGGWYVDNAVGRKLRVDDMPAHERRSRIPAHLLQGLEAAFIHRLTALGPAHGFSAVNNQHDGLLTVGAVPDAAVEQAMADSGLRYATLREKPYHPDLPVPGLG